MPQNFLILSSLVHCLIRKIEILFWIKRILTKTNSQAQRTPHWSTYYRCPPSEAH